MKLFCRNTRYSLMPPNMCRLAGMSALVGVFTLTPLAWAQAQKPAPGHDHATHTHTDICAGFVILSNGYAVLSAMAPTPSPGMQHGMQHGASHAEPAQHAMKAGMESMQHGAKAASPDHLLGHKHGEDIPTGQDMTCVPIGGESSTSWTAVSPSSHLQVTATSTTSTLAHNSRANEALSLHVMLDGKPVDQRKVRLFTRMPHHDRRVPGGHGPANDPDLQGFEAMPQNNGEYKVPMIDFSMAGPWLFEVQVQDGETMQKAYFATEIGEE